MSHIGFDMRLIPELAERVSHAWWCWSSPDMLWRYPTLYDDTRCHPVCAAMRLREAQHLVAAGVLDLVLEFVKLDDPSQTNEIPAIVSESGTRPTSAPGDGFRE